MGKFKVGDRVVSLDPTYQHQTGWPCGTVRLVYGGLNERLYSVVFDGLGGEGYTHYERELSPFIPSDSQRPDNINSPSHYQSSNGIECIEAIRAQLTDEEYRGYIKGNIAKYVWRERSKGGDESLRKAKWYLDKLIEALAKNTAV